MTTSQNWKPGDVALVDSWRGRGQIAFRCRRDADQPTWCVLDGDDSRGLHDDEVTAAFRPAVIDPKNREQRAQLLSDFHFAKAEGAGEMDALALALRWFASPRAPKPPEPTDLAVRVIADGAQWARVGPYWVSPAVGRHPRLWDYLVEREDFCVLSEVRPEAA